MLRTWGERGPLACLRLPQWAASKPLEGLRSHKWACMQGVLTDIKKAVETRASEYLWVMQAPSCGKHLHYVRV